MTNIEIVALITVIVVVCEAIKRAGLKSRFIPAVAVVLGLVGSYFLSGGVDFITTTSGVLIGLSTTGGYRLIKTTILDK